MLMRWRAAHGYGEPRSDDLVEREDV